MTREATIKKIIEFLEENDDILTECAEQLDSYDGYIGDGRYYPMEELDELMSGKDPSELLRMAFYGYDEDTFTTDSHGSRTYGSFNPNRDYFTFNGYGNLVSSDYVDYSGYLDRYFIEALEEARRWVDAIDDNDELAALFDELEDCNA